MEAIIQIMSLHATTSATTHTRARALPKYLYSFVLCPDSSSSLLGFFTRFAAR